MSAELGVLIGLLLAVAAVVGVARPLLRSGDGVISDETSLNDLQARRDAAYQVLRDLDSDYQVGRLAEDDYRQMRVQALAQAAEIVAQMDTYNARQPAPKRAQAPKPVAPASKAEPSDAFCPRCGTPHEPDDAFCRKCGRTLKA